MADEATEESNASAGEESGGGEKTFTQADLDRIVQERLARVKTTPPDDYDDLKAKAEKLAEIEAANQTELEKAQARAEAAEKAAQEAADRARKSDIRSAVTSAATAAGAVDVDAVFALLPPDAVTVGDDGQVTGAVEAVASLLEAKPYLVGKKPTGSADGGPRSGGETGPRQLGRDDLSRMTPEQIVEADNKGQFRDLYAGNP